MKNTMFNTLMQIGLNIFTIGGFFLTASKMPEYGLISMLISEIFWFYAGWKAWKEANQWGVLVNTSIMCCIIIYGVINYWFLT